MGNGSARGRFARFLVEVRFGWQVTNPNDRAITIAFSAVCAATTIIAIFTDVMDACDMVIMSGILVIGIAITITDTWRTGHHLLTESDATTRTSGM